MVRIYLFTTLLLVSGISNAETKETESSWKAKSVEIYQDKEIGTFTKSSAASEQKNGEKTDSNYSEKQLQLAKSKPKDNQAHPINSDFWVYDAYTRLIRDYDHDGYHYVFEVSFDVDTIYDYENIYARLYLGDGHTFREYHTTSVFTIDDNDSDDDFFVETELLTGFNSFDYDILIEVYHASDDHLLAVYDHQNDADLSYVPLESYDYEYYSPPHQHQVTRSRESGGSSSPFVLLGLVLLAVVRYAVCDRRYDENKQDKKISRPKTRS